MPTPAVKGAREQAKKSAPEAGADEKRKKGPWTTEPPKPGWAMTQEKLAAMSPTVRRRHLLFSDLLDMVEVGSMFPRDSVESSYCMPDPRIWTQALELPSERQNRLLGILKAAEARGRIRALRLRYTRMRAEEISLLIQKQRCARAAIRLELFLPPQLKPTKIPDPLDRQERRRVETILEEEVDGNIFPR